MGIGALLALGIISCGDDDPSAPVPRPTQLGIVTQPSATAQSGAVLAVQPVVQLLDADGEPFAQSGVTVTATLSNGGGTLGGTLSGTTSVVTDAAGLATFTDLRISGIVGARSLTFTAPTLTHTSSGTITLTAGTASAAHSTIEAGAPQLPANGMATTSIFVQLRDAAGNELTSGAGYTLTLATTGGTLSAPLDLGNGTFLAELRAPGTAGTATISGMLNGAAMTSTATVAFVQSAK